MDKIWLTSYDTGVPVDISINEYKNLLDYLAKNVAKYADLPAFANVGVELTYREVDQLSLKFAAFLQNDLHLKKGERFAIMLPNLLQYVIAMFGALRAGLIVVNVNPLYTTRELEHQLKDSGASALLLLENFANVAQLALPNTDIKHVIVTEIGDACSFFKAKIVNFVVKYVKKMVPQWSIPGCHYYRNIIKQSDCHKFTPVAIDASDLAYLQYTGGTTGVSKGAMLTHGNMLANILQLGAWIAPFLKSDQKEVVVTALPLYHIFSLTVNCWFFLGVGGKNILITNPRDITSFVKELARSKFTGTTGVNTLFNALNNNPEFAKIDFSTVRYVISGGMALQRAVAERFAQITGVNIAEGYGLTEASPVVTCTPISTKQYTGSIGLPLPSTEVAIFHDDTELPLGSRGELCVRGPQVMKGYWNRDDATQKMISREGWLHTGDIAYMNEKGYVYVVDRMKNMIVVSGFNVYPNEIEDVVAQLPGVKEVAAIGLPDVRSGEKIKLFIVKNDHALTEKQVIDYCHTQLTRYKVPKDIEFRDELPKSNVGKILHRKLREEEDAKNINNAAA